MRGNPAARISDVRNVETVFKDGVAYNPDALIAASAGTVGEFNFRVLLRWPYNVLVLLVLALAARRFSKLWHAPSRSGAAPAARAAEPRV